MSKELYGIQRKPVQMRPSTATHAEPLYCWREDGIAVVITVQNTVAGGRLAA